MEDGVADHGGLPKIKATIFRAGRACGLRLCWQPYPRMPRFAEAYLFDRPAHLLVPERSGRQTPSPANLRRVVAARNETDRADGEVGRTASSALAVRYPRGHAALGVSVRAFLLNG